MKIGTRLAAAAIAALTCCAMALPAAAEKKAPAEYLYGASSEENHVLETLFYEERGDLKNLIVVDINVSDLEDIAGQEVYLYFTEGHVEVLADQWTAWSDGVIDIQGEGETVTLTMGDDPRRKDLAPVRSATFQVKLYQDAAHTKRLATYWVRVRAV